MAMSLFGPKGPTYLFELEGLTCSKCVAAVKRVTKQIDGVKKAKVSFNMKRLTIIADEEIETDPIIAAIEEEGFEAERIG
jgi:Cu+-exporting ATPase